MGHYESHNMEYNSQKENLIIPEYGRNVQQLVMHAMTIEDRAERQDFVERIIKLMMQMHPQNKNMEDYKEKLWRHVFRISDFKIDVDPIEGMEIPTPDNSYTRPDAVGYPDAVAKFRHYGKNVQRMITKALEMEDLEKRGHYAAIIGNYMKLAYRTWSIEHYVSDEVIVQDLEALSDGKLILSTTLLDKIPIPTNTVARGKKKRSVQSRDHRENNKRSHGSNSRNKGRGGRRKYTR